MSYYYFKKRGGKRVNIVAFAYEINTQLNLWLEPLTAEQTEFYLANPSASVQEVVNCQLASQYTPPVPDVSEYAIRRKAELKTACLGSISVSGLEYAMASDKLNNLTADCYYSLVEAREVVGRFRSESKRAMNLYDNYSAQMSEAQSVEAVDTLFNAAITALNGN